MITIPPSLVDVIRGNAGVGHVHCITNGFEPADFPVKLAPTVPVNDRVRISYTGVWRPGYGLEDLYRAVRLLMERRSPHLKRLLVDAAGFRPGPARQFGVEDVIVEHGAVPHQVALDLMNAADALYLPVPLGYYAKASLPGKLFEYLGSGRPILAVVPADSEVARVAGDVEGTLRIEPGDVPALAGAIESLCSGAEAGLFAPRRPEQLAAYTRAATTRALAGVFDQALHQGVGTAR
ncbi:MAG: hypothetical protein H7346_12500, partial [Burkholderiaceae bacterium]|nr:hypothetical protein [Burkholderiaceae bacterium]